MTHLLPKVPLALACLAALILVVPMGRAQTVAPAPAASPAAAPAEGRSILLWPAGAPGALTDGGALDTPQLTIYTPPSNPTPS